jgi:transcriptional regulator with PAS, ATPase and Fis domain
MQVINCAAIPSQLLESVLFGHERGAFTGADRRSRGLFEEADGGTVFLDEVAELSAAAQAALLRVLETRQLTRVGSHELVAVDIRVVAATHRDLEAMCTAGTFREDLLYRLNTMTIQIPPLRERPEEIAALVRLFLEQANRANDRQVKEIDPDALDLLRAYRWPGNVRELRNVIERAVVIAPAEVVSPADLPPRLRMPSGGPGTAEAVEDEEGNLRERVKDYEAKLIREALAQAGGNQTEASRALGIPRRTLVRKIRDYGLKS